MFRCDCVRMRFGLLLMVLFCLPNSRGFSEMRVWKSKSGAFDIRAELISADDQSVKLKTEDGRMITVALSKLSQADLDYLAMQSETAVKTREDSRQIRRMVGQFYESVRDTDEEREELRKLLAADAQANLDRSAALFQNIQQPDRGHRPRVSDVAIDEGAKTAVANYRLRVKGKNSRMQMLFVSQEGQWGISGIIGPDEDGGSVTISFVDSQSTDGSPGTPPPGAARPSTSRGRPARQRSPSSRLTASDIRNRGPAAYAAGFCAKCHDDDGTGTNRGPDLTDDEWLHCDGSVQGIRQVLVSGVSKQELSDRSRPAMNPATNLIPTSDLDVLAEYVKSFGSDSD